jgi:hypothetical protein
MPLLSLESAAMLCCVDPRGHLGRLFRRRVGPLLFRAGGREPAPPLPWLTAVSHRPPMVTFKGLLFCRMCSPSPRFIAEGRWAPWPAGDLVALLQARGESCHGFHSSRQAQLALSPFYGLEGRPADRGARGVCRFDAGGRWWAALLVGLHRGARGEWKHWGTGLLCLSCLRRFDLANPGTLAGGTV